MRQFDGACLWIPGNRQPGRPAVCIIDRWLEDFSDTLRTLSHPFLFPAALCEAGLCELLL